MVFVTPRKIYEAELLGQWSFCEESILLKFFDILQFFKLSLKTLIFNANALLSSDMVDEKRKVTNFFEIQATGTSFLK